MDLVDRVLAFETGEMTPNEQIKLFSEMVKDGSVWELQGSYGRGAKWLMEKGYLAPNGDILKLYGDGDGTENDN
jgi:hypothetical protein